MINDELKYSIYLKGNGFLSVRGLQTAKFFYKSNYDNKWNDVPLKV